MQSYKRFNIILFWGQIVDLVGGCILTALDLAGVFQIGITTLEFWFCVLCLFTFMSTINQYLLWRELKEKTPNIIVDHVCSDVQKSDEKIISFARVGFANQPLGNSQEAKAKDIFAQMYFFDNNIKLIKTGEFIGRWGTSTKIPNAQTTPEELERIKMIDFEPNGYVKYLDVAMMFSDFDKIYRFDNSWFPNRVIDDEFFLTTGRCNVMVRLRGSRFDQCYYFEIFRDKEKRILAIQKKGFSKKKQRDIKKELLMQNDNMN